MIFLFEINHLTSVNKPRTKKTAEIKNKQTTLSEVFFVRLTWTPPPPTLTKISGTAHGSRQLFGMTTVHLGVVCKLIFAFLPENIGVGAR